ncbi:hypothetical protein [Muricoccus vinaceus]|uniref:Uncharacterized protein n=1 Tax=Muricoccus vinaceus TaxID=424704 RepID=A0ABV6J3G3_9PROT
MDADLRRIVAVEVHRRRTGRCPVLVHALGTGETFRIEPQGNGFRDLATGLRAQATPEGIDLDGTTIALRLTGDIAFEGQDIASGERFTGHAGGGASVTLYDARRTGFFQYAVSDQDQPPDLLRA